MKLVLFILLAGFSLNSTCQKHLFFDTSFINTSSRAFFQKNPVIDSIVIEHNTYSVYLKTNWKNVPAGQYQRHSYDFYRSNFLGDMYLFEKKFGKFALPEKELVLLTAKDCAGTCSSHVTLNADSIKCRRNCTCPSDHPPADDYEIIFTKTEQLARIKNGTGQLQKQIQEAFNSAKKEISLGPSDSVIIYKVLIERKDSCLQSIELTEGSFSSFEQLVMGVLQRSCLWVPAEQGGRTVSFLSSVFVRLNKDNSITVDVVK